MNNSKDNKDNSNEKSNKKNEEKEKIFQTDFKINREHRIVPGKSINIRLYNTEQKSQEDKQNKSNSARHFSPNRHKNKEIDEELHKEEVDKEIEKRKNIFKEFIGLYSKFKMNRISAEININQSNNNIENGMNIFKNENLYYYIINKTWFNQFKNYCQKSTLSYSNINEDYPGQINNQHLILKDDTCLKLNSEKRIIINSKYTDNCICITPELWNFLTKICGGGPEIKFNPKKIENSEINNNNEIQVIRKAVHINLLFIPKKEIISNNSNKEPSININNPLNPFQCQEIKKILVNDESKDKIKIQYIYFDITKHVQELINYINQILNQNRNKFTNTPLYFGPTFNAERNNCFVENINYRLWLNDLDINPTELGNYIINQINKYEDVDFPMKFSQMDSLNNIGFHPFLLSNFVGYKVEDIFPNRYTKNFRNKNYYDTKYEDENSFPTITIIIEEYPYHFEEPKKNFFIKKCNFCCYRDYVYSGCICNKVFYCSETCKKSDLINHITTCKKGLFNFISEKNEKLYRIIKGRKEYFDNHQNEKENLPILGLTNLGNSCYMNSSLQCLFAIKELSNYFLYYFKDEYINKDNVLGTGGILTFGYINLLLNINNTTNNKYFTPNIFKIILGLCSKKYEGNDQEDAHEFLNYVLDMFHEDLNRVTLRPSLNNNDDNNIININNINISDEEKSIIDWNNFLKRNQSILIDLFYGQYKSCVICPKCHFKSINFNSFLSLELPITENKNYTVIGICFIDYLKETPYVYFNIILYKNELKIYFLRKKIANFLEIDMLEFEIVSIFNNEIIHIYEISEDIPNDIHSFYACRINPKYFYSPRNDRFNEITHKRNNENININEYNEYNECNEFNEYSEEKYKIDYKNLEYNINKRKNEIIEFNENKNINEDHLYLTLKYNDNIGLNYSLFQRAILQCYIIKNKRPKNIEPDEIIYLEKTKKCKDIYYEIFRKFVFNIAISCLDNDKKSMFVNIYNSSDIEKKNKIINTLFTAFFRNGFFNPSEVNIMHNFPDSPFILFLKNIKYNVIEVIPYSTIIDYNSILNRFYEKINIEKNKENEINLRRRNNVHVIDMNNQNPNVYADIVTNILLNNDITDNNYNEDDIDNNNNNNNINNENEIKNKNDTNIGHNNNNNNNNDNNNNGPSGLPGGGNGMGSKKRKKAENENEEGEENDNNDHNESSENEESDEDSDSNNNDNNSNNSLNDDENLMNEYERNFMNNIKQTEKDQNIDRIVIIWNRKYIKKFIKFYDINLFDISDRIYEKSQRQEISIEKCFEEFSKEEKLDKENLWKCQNCNESLQANKKIEIYNIPKILIIHLKRFNNNKKINTLIKFPLKSLELDKYINKTNKTNNKYDLFGVINHFGSLEYGHYTAFCKNYHDNNWYEYNDRIVNKIPGEKENEIIVNQNAYVLFYREQKNDYINWENIYNKKYQNIDDNNLKRFGDDIIYIKDNIEYTNNIDNIINDNDNDDNKIDIEINTDNDEKKN